MVTLNNLDQRRHVVCVYIEILTNPNTFWRYFIKKEGINSELRNLDTKCFLHF